MRFAMVTTFYPPYHFGGDATYVRGLTHALARRGHDVTVVHQKDAHSLLSRASPPKPLYEPARVQIHALESHFPALTCLATHQTGYPVVHHRQVRELLSQNFDVIHYQNISLMGGPAILSYGDGLKIYTTHDHWLVCPTHTLWRHNRELCTGRQCLTCAARYNRPPQLWRYGSWLERQCQHVDAFTATSQSCIDRHRRFGFKFPMRVIPPFLNEASTEPATPADAPDVDRPYYLFAGRLELIKGLQDVIPIIEADAPFDLRIAGAGTYEQELRKLAQNKPNIKFLGYQPPTALRSLYKGALAVVMPSLCYEVFPLVAIEAFREGAPIIARNREPYPELAEQSGGVILFDTQQDLQSTLGQLASDSERRSTLSRAGFAAYERNWTEQVAVDRYLAMIDEVGRDRPSVGGLTSTGVVTTGR